ncbi:MAG: hypothetical protein ACE15B_01715 [Bryobacteraceae bacterium]
MVRALLLLLAAAPAPRFTVEVTQLTHGPKNHFFGYIGHVKNIPWNGNGRYVVALETGFQDRMPKPGEAANVVLIDTGHGNAVTVIEQSRAWNFQQGTMFYWNPEAPDTQLFFNDRDPKTNQVFAVLFDIARKRRIREYRYPDTPFGNSGVAQNGGRFLGINYGRLARLRTVTGYPGAYDWTVDVAAPENDGIFLADARTGEKRLLISFARLAAELRVPGRHLFINHTLWNRRDDRIYFYVRADFDSREKRVNIPCSIRPDGSGLTSHETFIGGHPEWEQESRIIGAREGRMVLYDVDQKKLVGEIGWPGLFPDPEGDTALSPDGNWIVNGSRAKEGNVYTVLRRSDSAWGRSRPFAHPGLTKGDLRVDGSPAWNRSNDAFLFPAIAPDHTRQLFLGRIR